MKHEVLKKSWQKLWPEVMNKNVEVSESNTIDDELNYALGCLPSENSIS